MNNHTIYKARIPSRDKYTNNIEIEHIDRLDTAQFFNIKNHVTSGINDILIQICKDVFTESYEKGGKEAGAVLNIPKKEYALHEATQYGVVDFKEDETLDYYKIHNNSDKYSCILIHNHNTKGSFSKQDIYAFIKDESVMAIIVITCNANIFILIKERNKDYSDILSSIDSDYKTDYITPDTRKLMIENGLIERKVTTWENIQ